MNNVSQEFLKRVEGEFGSAIASKCRGLTPSGGFVSFKDGYAALGKVLSALPRRKTPTSPLRFTFKEQVRGKLDLAAIQAQ